MLLTTYYVMLRKFNSINGEDQFKNRGQVNSLKKKYMSQIEAQLQEEGKSLTAAQRDIMGLLVYNTCVTGVQSISLARLVEKSGYSRATVARAKKAICELGIFVVGYLADEQKGHYVFVLKLHTNYRKVMAELFNETSCETSNETSSKAETPCESKDEEPKKASTLFTFNSLNTRDLTNNMSHEQNELVSKIKESNAKPVYKENAEIIASMLPKKLDDTQKQAFNRIVNNQMKRVAPQFDRAVKTYVVAMFNEEVTLLKDAAKTKAILDNPNKPYYNWLEDDTTPAAPSEKEFDITKFEQGLFDIARKYEKQAPIFEQWQLEGFSSKEDYEEFNAEMDMPF